MEKNSFLLPVLSFPTNIGRVLWMRLAKDRWQLKSKQKSLTRALHVYTWKRQWWVTQFSSVAQSCPAFCNPMDCSMPCFSVHHTLLELAQTHVHWVGDAISYPPWKRTKKLFQHLGWKRTVLITMKFDRTEASPGPLRPFKAFTPPVEYHKSMNITL